MKKLLALVYGVVCYVLFLGTFLYAIAFVGDLGVPTSVDKGPATTPLRAVVIDALLLSVFAIQHSLMARQGFKQRWTRIVSWYVERSTFVLAASLSLALVLWQWRPIPDVIWDVRGTMAAPVLTILFWAGWGILLLSTWLINHFELFGLEQVWAYFKGREFVRPAFKTPSLYRWARHPIYLGFVIAFWSAPVMTVGHLLFSIATTGYILVGIHFEERDLIRAYGDAYREYRSRVPMLLPWKKASPETAKKTTSQAA